MPKRKMHPNSLDNLVPWKPGQTGNPEGKNGPQLVPILERMLDKELTMKDPITGKKSKKRICEWLALKLIANAFDSKEKSLAMIFDRIDGAVQKNITIDTSESSAVDAIKQQMRDYLKDNKDDADE